MIKKLRITNFKSWQDTGDIHLSKLTGFFGTNSSGKTSLLQLLLLLKQTTESSDRSQVLDFGSEKSYVELGTFKDIISNHDLEKSMSFQITWREKNPLKISNPEKKREILFKSNDLTFQTTLRQPAKGRMHVKRLAYSIDDQVFLMEKKPTEKEKVEYEYDLLTEPLEEIRREFEFKRSVGRPWALPMPVKFYGFPDQVKAYFQNTGFLSDLQLRFEELFSRIYYLGPLRDYPRRQYVWAGSQPADMGRRGEKAIDAILVSRERGEKISRGKGRGNKRFTVEEYVAYWLKELGLIHDFRVKSIVEGGNLYQVLLKLTPNSPEVTISDVGFGVSQILPVITLCYYVPPGSTLLIEQPEIHLHPRVQAGLADVFIDAIKRKDIRIILESHSEHLLRRLQRRMAEEEFDSRDAELYFCETTGGGSALKRLELDEFGNITNWPKGFFGDEMSEMAAMSQAIFQRKTKKNG